MCAAVVCAEKPVVSGYVRQDKPVGQNQAICYCQLDYTLLQLDGLEWRHCMALQSVMIRLVIDTHRQVSGGQLNYDVRSSESEIDK